MIITALVLSPHKPRASHADKPKVLSCNLSMPEGSVLPEEDPSGIEMLQDDTSSLSAREALHPLR